LGGLSLVVGALIAGPASVNTAQAQEAEPVKIGVMGPFTGPAGRTGEGIRKGALMAVDDAREQGLLPLTIDGEQRKIELVWVDSQSSPEKAVKAVSDAVNRQGVQLMVSGWHSSVAMAVSEAESGMGIVHIGHGGESQYICEK